MSLPAVHNLGTEFLSVDAHLVYYFIDELTPIAVLPPLIARSLINQSMKDIDEGFEEGSEGEQNAEGRGSSRSDLVVVGMTLDIGLESLQQYKVIELLLRMRFVELALYARQFNENLVQELYANLNEEFGNPESPAYGQVYVRVYVIDFSPANIAHYLSCPHYSDLEGTGLEEEVDFDKVTKVLTSDEGPIWPKTNMLNLNLMKMPHRALFRARAHMLYALATKQKFNSCIVIFKNIFRQIGQKKAIKIALPCSCLITEYLLCCKDLSLPFDFWGRALDALVMTKNIAPGLVPPTLTPSTQGHTSPSTSTR
ncbi:hypothetical protein M9H77_02333 [Catharanthus roseus]|uniref:Uncharacterized protein n=1 Tax=Catharanthus roseus TaxID=4058 RepID=A0ACC0C846_CATRO|nr:hypothetical protein M9H77_02333 [Catharanthus roseus]